jgi:prepilin-type N-terminal cleavage/methylation domain-containing protein
MVPTPSARRTRSGFTLVELAIVVVVIAILVALLLPAINSAVRTAKNAAVQAEINQLAAALESFKSKYGDYPPSRILLTEDGNYAPFIGSTSPLVTIDLSAGSTDITVGQLATRTVAAFRKFWPRVQIGASNPSYVTGSYWYDFNGNGRDDSATPYVLHGHECLAFFLGGVPYLDPKTGDYSTIGFGQDVANPFSNGIGATSTTPANPMASANRLGPFFEFAPSRLYLDVSNPTNPQVPAYLDSLGNAAPTRSDAPGLPINFYAYFSAYGSNNYDANDVNFLELDSQAQGPISLQINVGFPPGVITSAAPNPYSGQKPQTYQILSSGADGLYGVGGLYTPNAPVPLPFDSKNTLNGSTGTAENDASLRQREYDNLTNFKASTLN